MPTPRAHEQPAPTGEPPRRGLAARLDIVQAWAERTVGAVERSREFQQDRAFLESLLPWMERFVRYFDGEVRGFDNIPSDRPVLLVANHSGGPLTPDTSAVMLEWYRRRGVDVPLVGLAFDAAFSIPGFGDILRRLGLVPASRANAAAALERGDSVLVYPGGAHEVFRPWGDRNRIDFGGHDGFVKLALQRGVPVIPVTGHGGHETVVVLSRGERLGRLFGLDRLRVPSCPVMLTVPFGVSLGIPGFPLPAKVTVQIGEPIDWTARGLGPEDADNPEAVRACYDEVCGVMQDTLDALSAETPSPLLTGLRTLAGRVLGRRAT